MDGCCVGWNFSAEEGFAVVGVAEVHFEVVPGFVLKHGHVPCAGDSVGKLPDDVIAIFVGEAFEVGLDDGIASLPEKGAQGVKGGGAFFRIRAHEVLEGIDSFDFREEVVKPSHACFRLAVLRFFDKLFNFALAEGAVQNGIALEHSNFDFVVGGEQKGFPFLFGSFFKGELAVGVVDAEKLHQFIEGGEVVLFGKDSSVIAHGGDPMGRIRGGRPGTKCNRRFLDSSAEADSLEMTVGGGGKVVYAPPFAMKLRKDGAPGVRGQSLMVIRAICVSHPNRKQRG